MNIQELVRAYFEGESGAQLGQAAGLDRDSALRVLGTGLPLQLDALAEHAQTVGGQVQLTEAMQNLPQFGSVADVLRDPEGASNLERAGELLAPALLGDRQGSVLSGAAAASPSREGAARLLHMALPLLLSLLAHRGGALAAGANLPGLLAEQRGRLSGLGDLLRGPAAVGAGAAALGASALDATGMGAAGAGAAGLGAAENSPAGLLDFLRGELGGTAGDRIATAAGFGGSGAGRATLATLPLVLGALAQKGRTESGANELLNLARPLDSLTGPDGRLRPGLLDSQIELGQVEGQGRGLMGSLFGSAEEMTGRLGTALGGSGVSAGRLLAMLAPLVLSLLGGRARASGMGGAGLSSLLAGVGPLLPGMFPTGLGNLASLLPGQAPAVAATVPPAPRPVATTATPRPVTTPVTPPPTTTVTTAAPARRGGFPWWLPLLLLLGAGGCYLATRQPQTATPPAATTPQAASILVTNPVSDSNLPAEPFTMSGTGPAGTSLRIEDEGQEVAQATVADDGSWSAELPAPTPGVHTYSVIGGDDLRSEFKVNITDDAAGEDAGALDTEATGTDATDTDTGDTVGAASGEFSFNDPTADATLPAGGFTLRGTGTPGDILQVLEDGVSLGNVTVAEDGSWSLDVPSPTSGAHTYAVQSEGGNELGTLNVAVGEATGEAAACTEDYTLSIGDGQTVNEPFRFGGQGGGEGYSVTVRRGERVIGTKRIPLDSTCGWSYESRPGAGTITYEVRPLGNEGAEPLSTVTLTVRR